MKKIVFNPPNSPKKMRQLVVENETTLGHTLNQDKLIIVESKRLLAGCCPPPVQLDLKPLSFDTGYATIASLNYCTIGSGICCWNC